MENDILRCNRKAIYYLNKGDAERSFYYLTRAKNQLKGQLLLTCSKSFGITLNNFACYYKAQGLPQQALLYLHQAIELEKSSVPDASTLAATYLNLSSLQSDVGSHVQSLESSLQAITLLSSLYTSSNNLALIFITAHYNAGMQYRFLNNTQESQKILEAGLDYSKSFLGPHHSLTSKLEQAISLMPSSRSKRTNLTPIKSIRTSTAATSTKKKRNSDFSASSTRFSSSYNKITKKNISPVRYHNRFVHLFNKEPVRSETMISGIKKIRTNNQKNEKKTQEKSVQVECDEKASDLRERSARKIQRAWRRYYRSKIMGVNIDQEISVAERRVSNMMKCLNRLREQKLRIEGRVISDIRDFKPVPCKGRIGNEFVNTFTNFRKVVGAD